MATHAPAEATRAAVTAGDGILLPKTAGVLPGFEMPFVAMVWRAAA